LLNLVYKILLLMCKSIHKLPDTIIRLWAILVLLPWGSFVLVPDFVVIKSLLELYSVVCYFLFLFCFKAGNSCISASKCYIFVWDLMSLHQCRWNFKSSWRLHCVNCQIVTTFWRTVVPSLWSSLPWIACLGCWTLKFR
jgi:hypothetical protein